MIFPATTIFQAVGFCSKTFFRILVPTLLAGLLAVPVTARDQFALLIANSDYQKPGWDDLKTPQNDVDALNSVLSAQYGFEVEILRDATRSDIVDAIETIKTRVDEDDSLLIYFAGHGILRAGDGGYWVGVDASTTSRAGWLKYDVINDLIDYEAGMKARHVMVVADSCYSGAALRSHGEFEPNPNETRAQLLSRRYNQRSRTVLTSGGTEPVLDGIGDSKHSVFALELLNKLQSNTVPLDGNGLFTKIEPEVFGRTQRVLGALAQAPEYGPLRGVGHNGGDFVFIPAGMSLPSTSMDPVTPGFDLGFKGPTSVLLDMRGQKKVHIGDENFRDTKTWAPKIGRCFEFRFEYPQRLEKLTLNYDVFGADETYVEVNGEVFPFEKMVPKAGEKWPNYWTDPRTMVIPVGRNFEGPNWIKICARAVANGDHPGDIDDFQIRNLVVIAN